VDDLDDASLKNAAQKAEELAAIAPPNPERMPAVGAQTYPSVNDFDEATANARAPQMIPHVKTIIDTALKQEAGGGRADRRDRTGSRLSRIRRGCPASMKRPIRS